MGEPDTGLAGERTALAWQRTALATTAGAAVMGRLTFEELGLVAVATLGAALALSGWILVESRSRHRDGSESRRRRGPRGGLAPAVLSTAVALIALTELAALGTR